MTWQKDQVEVVQSNYGENFPSREYHLVFDKSRRKKPGWNLYKNAANVENISWKDRVKNSELYCSLENVTFTIQNRRISLSGHVFRDEMSQSSPAQC